MFFLNLDDESDISGTLQLNDDGTYELNFRFRYYTCENDPDPYSGWDEKKWYTARSSAETTDEEALALLTRMLARLEEHCGNKADIIRARSPEEYLEILKTKSWANMKVLSEEEAREQGYDAP